MEAGRNFEIGESVGRDPNVAQASSIWITRDKPAILLAPMEGVTDAPMRHLLTSTAVFTHCVTEFLRIAQDVPPDYVFTRHVPELKTGSMTEAGVPLVFQLLGGDPERMARAANVAVNNGALAIDLNFGCPAQTVNRHDGGATLLKFPSRIKDIVAAVRMAVRKDVPVSAKLRLGWDSIDGVFETARAAEEGGADWITVHGRTKTQGYTPPAYWEPIGRLNKMSKVPVIANGDIWTVEDFERCREETGCLHYMLGRGVLANPFLSTQIAPKLGLAVPEFFGGDEAYPPAFPTDEQWERLTFRFVEATSKHAPNANYTLRRLKQWYRMVHNRRPFPGFDFIKKMESMEEFTAACSRNGSLCSKLTELRLSV